MKQSQTNQSNQICRLRETNGDIISNRRRLVERVQEFYQDLYDSKVDLEPVEISQEERTEPPILSSEVRHVIETMKPGKAPGEDKIAVDMLKEGGEELDQALAKLYNYCQVHKKIPKKWYNAIIILLFKKGDAKDLKNYRPISLLSALYKIFTKIITNRITNILDSNQPNEQPGFRRGFSTIDHIHTLNQEVEKSIEYRLPVCMAFIDYEKAFDSIEILAVLKALKDQNVPANYMQLLQNIYNSASATIKLHEVSQPIFIKRGVRQGDTISPKLFIAALENIFRGLNWERKGININGSYLSHLRFADDIVILAKTPQELHEMIQELNEGSLKVGMKMNMNKTKVMFNPLCTKEQIVVGTQIVEEVGEYTYLGQIITFNKDIDKEIKRRIILGWAAYGKHKNILESELPICLKKKIVEQIIIPIMTYGSETWSLTASQENKLQVAQRSMERKILGVTWQDRKSNAWIRERTKIRDIILTAKNSKWRWAGHVCRQETERWTRRTTEWRPWYGGRGRGRPKTRWRDEIDRELGKISWRRMAEDRSWWKQRGKAFAQQWAING